MNTGLENWTRAPENRYLFAMSSKYERADQNPWLPSRPTHRAGVMIAIPLNGGLMKTGQAKPESIDAYISGFPPEKRSVLERIRQTVRAAAPHATEAISYRMPTFMQDGVLVHFAAFKAHIGLYPPIRGDAGLEEAIAPYAGEKGNLRFSLDQSVPYELIERIVKYQVKKNLAKAASKTKRGGA